MYEDPTYGLSDHNGGFTLFNTFRNVRYAEFRPPVILQAPAPASGDGAASVTLHARQQYNLTCVGHKAVTWHVPGRADTGLAREHSRCGT